MLYPVDISHTQRCTSDSPRTKIIVRHESALLIADYLKSYYLKTLLDLAILVAIYYVVFQSDGPKSCVKFSQNHPNNVQLLDYDVNY